MTDHDGHEAELRRRLGAVDPPPPRLDVDQIVQTGRSQVRRRRYLAAGGTAAVVFAVSVAVPVTVGVGPPAGDGPPAASGGPSTAPSPSTLDCEVIKLPVPDGLFAGFGVPETPVGIHAIDPTGRHVAGAGSAAPEAQRGMPAVVWRDGGAPEVLGEPGTEMMPRAVNARGTVVGYGWDGEDTYGWVHRGATMTRLPAPEGYGPPFPEAVNGSGDVAGSVGGLGPDRPDAIAVWPADAPDRPWVLTAPDGGGVKAISIHDDGRVVGSASGGSGGYVWEPDGTVRRLALPDGADRGQVEAAQGNWAVGSVTVPVLDHGSPPGTADPAPRHAVVPVRWDLRTGASETFGAARYGGRAAAIAVAAAGDLVLGERNPVVVRDGFPFTLPALAGGAGIPRPLVVNEDGTVFAGTVDNPGAYGTGVPVRWHC